MIFIQQEATLKKLIMRITYVSRYSKQNFSDSSKKFFCPSSIFTQIKKQHSSVSTDKFNSSFKFHEKVYKKGSLESKINNKMQSAAFGTDHTITTKRNEEMK